LDRSFLVGLIGRDLGPSLSPALHEREADELGVRYLYKLIDLDVLGLGADDVGRLVAEAQRLGFAGLNITHPAKQTVVEHLDDLDEDAATLRAVNTVVFHDGRVTGHNTDWSGFSWGLKRALPKAKTGNVILLGAGGAGTAVAYSLGRLGVQHLTIVDPAGQRAERAKAVVAEAVVETAASVDALGDALEHADGVVNASPVGMTDSISPLPESLLRNDMWVLDIIYRPHETELLRQARRKGCTTANGGGMLVAQAAEAFRLITGLTPDIERMYRHFEAMTR
jgi:shikimate dehydrogenase